MSDFDRMVQIYEQVGGKEEAFRDSEVAHLVVSGNRVVGAHLVKGLRVEPEETESGIKAHIVVEPGVLLFC